MSILQIIQYPDLRLRRKGRKVVDVKSAEIKKIIRNMFETLANTKNCAALAATQLNIERPPNIIVMNYQDSEDDDAFCLINPEILAKEGHDLAEEGCMSIFSEDIHTKIKRATKIRVKTLTTLGKQIELEANGFIARCIQHECDHLSGILYIDHLSKLKRALLEKKILNLIKN